MDFPMANCADPVHGEVPTPSHPVVVLSGVTKKPWYLLAGCNVMFVIRPLSVQAQVFMGSPARILAAGTCVTCRLPCDKAPCSRHSLLKVTNFYNTTPSARLPVHLLILFNNSVESGQKRRFCLETRTFC